MQSIHIAFRTATSRKWGNSINSSISTRGLSSRFPWLRSPTSQDANILFQCMNHREGSLLTDPHSIEPFNTDWNKQYKGQSKIILLPKTAQEVANILKYCNEAKIGIVPQGGNTGLVGGSIPIHDEVIISTRLLNDIKGLDEDTPGILKCGAGSILQDLHDYAAARRYIVPLDLGSKGSCCIGGNVATNAGGQYYYRHRSLHANVLGLEVVLADGRILDLMSTINLKDNTGYDFKHLFVGAEGTLGVITKVALQCPHMPTSKNAAFLACRSFQQVQLVLQLAKEILGEIMSAFEYMDGPVLNMVASVKLLPLTQDDGSSYPFCILVETQGSQQDHDMAKMELFVEQSMQQQLVVDGILAQDLTQLRTMWDIRESCNPVVLSKGYIFKYDISLPIHDFDDFVQEMKGRLCEHTTAQIVTWGHVVDGNMHFNVVTPGLRTLNVTIKECIEPFLFESVIRRGGSISAEHGLGQCKNNYLPMAKTKVALDLMHSIKHMFDPNGILNPGKYLPTK